MNVINTSTKTITDTIPVGASTIALGNFISTYTIPTSVALLKMESSDISIYPNPFSLQTTIAFNQEQKNIIIKITDLLGKEIKTLNFIGKKLTIERGEMRKGIYFVRITDDKKNVVNKKIIVQ